MSADHGTRTPEDQQHGAPPQRKRGRLLWTLIATAVLAVALLLGWLPHHKRNKEVNAKALQHQNALPTVEVQTVHSASSELELTLPGTVTPLRSAHIYARASGYLKNRYVDLGDTVRKGQLLGIISAPDLDSSVAQQAALVQQSKDSVSTAPFVQTGQPVDLTFSELPGQTFKGNVVRSSESLSQQTRTLLTEVQITDALHRLRPGMFASLQMHYRAPNPGILISGDSLLTTARGQFVPVVQNNVIQMLPVHVGRDLGTQVYITAGLKDGDLVVVNPNDLVKQGARVSTRPAPAGQQGGNADPTTGGKSDSRGGQTQSSGGD
jgi:multidrug efflux pump subunit AcrA (membrane-fusion protein)